MKISIPKILLHSVATFNYAISENSQKYQLFNKLKYLKFYVTITRSVQLLAYNT